MVGLKFRAWDKESNQMIEWNQFKNNLVGSDFESATLEIMQWLGAEDDKGKDVYAGDILHVISGNGDNRIEFNLLIDMIYVDSIETVAVDLPIEDKENFQYNYDGKDIRDLVYSNEVEIIGNVHQNPELLEEDING